MSLKQTKEANINKTSYQFMIACDRHGLVQLQTLNMLLYQKDANFYKIHEFFSKKIIFLLPVLLLPRWLAEEVNTSRSLEDHCHREKLKML